MFPSLSEELWLLWRITSRSLTAGPMSQQSCFQHFKAISFMPVDQCKIKLLTYKSSNFAESTDCAEFTNHNSEISSVT